MKNVSTSKSSSIRDIENKYGINLTTCTRGQLDALTSKYSTTSSIHKLDDLMLNTKQFDINNMSDIERANLKYLVMSTDEVSNLISKKAKSVYYKAKNTRIRSVMSYNDFYQVCAYKLLLNDGILKFNSNYKLDPAMHCWFTRVAMWKSYKKVTDPDEITILDKPCNDDNDTTIGDLILKDSSTCDASCFDTELRIKNILNNMDKTPNNRIIIKAGNTSLPMSEYNIAKLFIVYDIGKKELSKMMYNVTNNKLVSNQIFNKFYKQTMMHIANLLNKEANDIGETFNINEEDL